MATAPASVIEALFAVPPREFTRARNERVAALRRSGHTDAAEAVRRLRRPAATLWATNQLARLEPGRLTAFIDAVAELRRAQLRDGRAAADALKRQRSHLDGLVDAARRHLVASGFKPTPGALTRIASTLQGAAVDRHRAQDLRHGRLTEELAAPGFEVFAGLRPARLRLVPGGQATESRRRGDEGTARAEHARQRRAAEAEARKRAAEQRRAEAEERRAAAEAVAREVDELNRRLAEA